MKFTFLSISRNSIRFKLFIGLLLVMIPVVSLLIYNNYYAVSVVRNQVAESYRNMMSMSMKQLDNNLEDVDNYLSNLGALNTDMQIMEFTGDDTEYYLAKMRLTNKVSSDIGMYNSISSIFVYSLKRDDFTEVFRYTDNLEEKQKIINYITKACRDNAYLDKRYPEKWYSTNTGSDYYLLRILKMRDTYIGAWVKVENMLAPLNSLDIGEKGISLLVTEEGVPMMHEAVIRDNRLDLKLDLNNYHLLGDKYKYLVVGEKSTKGNYSLMALIPDHLILEKLPFMQRITALVSIVLIGLLPLCLFILRKVLLVPLKHLMLAMKRIREGNLEVRIEPFAAPDEIQMVNDTFNKMVTRIEELKINVYEEKINRQKAELQHLQLQINPHFFLNSLNIIYALSLSKNFEVIKEMSLSLIQYFRYMFGSNLAFVSLQDELKHVLNYIRIQELRFSRSLIWEVEAPEFLQDTPVPPLVIHTFVENTIKYAVTLDDPVKISIRIQFKENENMEHCIGITVEDTGKGFKEEVLAKLQKGEQIIDDRGEHIGIWNLQRRLELLYPGKAGIKFRNRIHGGAIVEIVIPLRRRSVNVEVEDGTDTDR